MHPAILLQIARTITIAIARNLLPIVFVQPDRRSPDLICRVPVRRHEVDTHCIRPRCDHETRRDHHRGRGSFGVRLRRRGLQLASHIPHTYMILFNFSLSILDAKNGQVGRENPVNVPSRPI